MSNTLEKATFAGGCFWCTEAIFQRLLGVVSVVSGYTGGLLKNPTYEQVCSGKTGHAEAIQIEFDPKIITYENLLEIFFKLHDPTTVNQQGADTGTQYRSAIFYHNQSQKNSAENFIQKLTKEKIYHQSIVTKIEPFTEFYKAEEYHQDFYNQNNTHPYCQVVIDPKIQKLMRDFKEMIKPDSIH